MQHISFYLFIIGHLFLSSCLFEGSGESDLIIAESSIDSSREQRRRDREEVRGFCKDDRNCEDICEDVYDEDNEDENEGNVTECLELQYDTVISFEEILEFIEEPVFSQLRTIEANDFAEFLDISVAPWVEKTKNLNNDEAEALLTWIASESKHASAIVSAYENLEDFDTYEGVQNLLEEIAPELSAIYPAGKWGQYTEQCAELCSAVSMRSISQNKSFWEIIQEENNSPGEQIVCEILLSNCKKVRRIGVNLNGTIINVINVKTEHCPLKLREDIATAVGSGKC